MSLDKNRCVVTGLGMISAIGNSVDECWDNAIKSVTGIKETKSVDTENCYSKVAAEVNYDFDKDDSLDRVSKLCIHACKEAIKDASLGDFNGSDRVSVIIGSCVGGVVSIEHYYKNDRDKNDVAKMPISAIANSVANYFNVGGVVTNIANACAAGTISIAYACDLIRDNKADIVIAGGADAFASVPYSGFLALHALDPNGCAPFNRCEGITLGEGSGCVIVESYEHAKKRNAKMYCEVLGSGVSSDAHHITAPRPDGEGQMNAIKRAIKSSGIDEAEIGYVNAHGTGTIKNDEAEFLSLHTIFDEKNDDLSVSSTKAMVGHCLGAAGAIEAVLSIKALTTNTLPPTLGFKDEDMALLNERAGKIDFIPNVSKKKELTNVMSNSFAFGGNNASIIFSKNEGNVSFNDSKDNVVITGLGLVTPCGNGKVNYLRNYKNFKAESNSIHSNIEKEEYDELGIKMAFYRKLDNFSKLQTVSGVQALKDSNIEVTDENATKIGIVVGTSEGALASGCLFEEAINLKGNAYGSAFNFPNTVYNAAGGYLSICSGIKGYNVTVTNGAASGLQSICYAMNVLNQGNEDYVLATGADENIEIIDELYKKLDLVSSDIVNPYDNKDGFNLSDGAITVVMENESHANMRNAKKYCKVIGYGMSHKNAKFATLKGSDEALDIAIEKALKDSNTSISEIDGIFGFANGLKAIDDIEINSLKRVFNDELKNKYIFNVKEYLKEGRAASATLAVAHAALMLSGEIKEENAYVINENINRITVESNKLNKILVISFASGGNYAAVVLEK